MLSKSAAVEWALSGAGKENEEGLFNGNRALVWVDERVLSWAWWDTPVILATHKAEAGELQV